MKKSLFLAALLLGLPSWARPLELTPLHNRVAGYGRLQGSYCGMKQAKVEGRDEWVVVCWTRIRRSAKVSHLYETRYALADGYAVREGNLLIYKDRTGYSAPMASSKWWKFDFDFLPTVKTDIRVHGDRSHFRVVLDVDPRIELQN